jgi:hypothetical protein
MPPSLRTVSLTALRRHDTGFARLCTHFYENVFSGEGSFEEGSLPPSRHIRKPLGILAPAVRRVALWF